MHHRVRAGGFRRGNSRIAPARIAPNVVRSVFLVFACLYALSIGRGFYSSDGEVMFLTTVALVEDGSFALDPDPALPQIMAGQDEHFYSKYDPGLSLAMVPYYMAGDWIAGINAAHRYRVAALAVLFLPVLAGAGAVAGVARLALRLTAHRRALWIALAAGIASPLWWYARVLFAEAVLAWALVTVVGLVWKPHPRRHPVGIPSPLAERGSSGATHGKPIRAYGNTPLRMLLAGLVFGAGIAARAAFAIYGLALLWLIWRSGGDDSQRERVRRVIMFGIGVLPGIALVLWHNALRFGDPLVFGYGGEGFTAPVWKGAAGLLISPGKGALIIAPPLIVSLLLWPRLRRSAPALAEFLALALVFYGAWWAWDGGWCWGPRFVVPLIPLSMLPLAVIGRSESGADISPQRSQRTQRKYKRDDEKGLPVFAFLRDLCGGIFSNSKSRIQAALWAMLGVLILAGIAINGAAVLADVVPHYAAVAGESAADVDRINWTLRDGLPAAAWDRVLHSETEPLALFRLDDTGLPVTWTAGMPALVSAGLAFGLWQCGRLYRQPTR